MKPPPPSRFPGGPFPEPGKSSQGGVDRHVPVTAFGQILSEAVCARNVRRLSNEFECRSSAGSPSHGNASGGILQLPTCHVAGGCSDSPARMLEPAADRT